MVGTTATEVGTRSTRRRRSGSARTVERAITSTGHVAEASKNTLGNFCKKQWTASAATKVCL